ncbi:MAG: DUF58 domain-containing protein [Gemmatimonadota bacterium]
MRLAPARGQKSGASFVDPAVLARIDNLELLARTVVDGFINGLHRSPYLGLSVDFAEHRPYMPGDDIRRIDWRLWGRTDRYYVKEFEADTNTNFVCLLDTSASMGYGSHAVSKLEYGKFLAASLTYFSHGQRDRVGMVTFDDAIRDYVPPSAKHLDVILHTVDRARAGNKGALEAPLVKTAEALGRRGIVVLISDLYEPPEAVIHAVRHLRSKGNDVIVFHVLDPWELDFPFEDAGNFQDVETGQIVPVVPATQRERYRELVRAHSAELAERFTKERVDYALLDTSKPLDVALFQYLSTRERLSRVR